MWMNSFSFLGIGIFLDPYLFQKMKGLIWRWNEEVEVVVEDSESSSSAVEVEGRKWM